MSWRSNSSRKRDLPSRVVPRIWMWEPRVSSERRTLASVPVPNCLNGFSLNALCCICSIVFAAFGNFVSSAHVLFVVRFEYTSFHLLTNPLKDLNALRVSFLFFKPSYLL